MRLSEVMGPRRASGGVPSPADEHGRRKMILHRGSGVRFLLASALVLAVGLASGAEEVKVEKTGEAKALPVEILHEPNAGREVPYVPPPDAV